MLGLPNFTRSLSADGSNSHDEICTKVNLIVGKFRAYRCFNSIQRHHFTFIAIVVSIIHILGVRVESILSISVRSGKRLQRD